MIYLIFSLIAVYLLLSSSTNVVVASGVMINAPKGYVVSNLDPSFNSTYNNEIYDPNFLPGFQAGLTNTTVSWTSGVGYAKLGYAIGPWAHLESIGIPHFAVGPQCCNFKEVPHTQQFRRVDWGDYYSVRAGLGRPGVNVENYTTDFSVPAYVGLRTDWDWKVQVSLNWKSPAMMTPSNEWGAVGIDITQYVPNAPGKLVGTLINFWMDSNSSSHIVSASDGIERSISSNLVTYHVLQMREGGNMTLTMDISPYLGDTLRVLGFQNVQSQPPVISYIYLNVEGYNFSWNTTLWSFNVMSQPNNSDSTIPILTTTIVFVSILSAVLVYLVLRKKISIF